MHLDVLLSVEQSSLHATVNHNHLACHMARQRRTRERKHLRRNIPRLSQLLQRRTTSSGTVKKGGGQPCLRRNRESQRKPGTNVASARYTTFGSFSRGATAGVLILHEPQRGSSQTVSELLGSTCLEREDVPSRRDDVDPPPRGNLHNLILQTQRQPSHQCRLGARVVCECENRIISRPVVSDPSRRRWERERDNGTYRSVPPRQTTPPSTR